MNSSPRYIILKDFAVNAWESPQRILKLIELREVIDGIDELEWGFDPKGDMDIRNPDGEVVKIHKYEGFKILDSNNFCICYEYYKGIAVHLDEIGIAKSYVNTFKKALSCNVYEIN